MTIEQTSAEGDLAFMRAIVEERGSHDRSFGINYAAAGLLYGVQCLLNGWLLLGEIEAPAMVWLAIGILPTVLFIMVNVFSVWKARENPMGVGTARRAMTAAFAGGGIAILILASIFGMIAFERDDWTIWMLFPIVVCAVQGAIWFTTTMIKRELWHGVTSFGWFASCFVLSVFTTDVAAFVVAMGAVLLLLMALPGMLILRATSNQAE